MKNMILFLTVVMFLLTPILLVSAADIAAAIQEAVKKGDVNICNQLGQGAKDGCLFPVAVAKKDTSVCDLMSDASKMAGQDAMCKAAVTKDAKYCDSITTLMGVGKDEMKATCLSWVTGKNPYEGLSKAEQEAASTSIITQLKDKILSLFGAGGSETESGASGGSSPSDKSSGESAKVKCAEDCGDKICSNGKCIEPKLTFVFVPVNWKGTMEDFDRKVDERVDLLLTAIPLKDCKSSVKIIKSHENCEITLSPHLYVVPWTYKDLLAVRDCVRRITTYYDYGVGLTDAQQSLYPKVGGVQSRLTMTALVTTNRTFATIHELGHLFGLKDEYCNDVSITSPLSVIYRKCGFDISPNPLKTEYGCREKDSSYDNDEFPDCCWSDKYEPGCKGNVGLSESELAKKIYDSGAYEAIDGIFENNNILYDGIMKCKTDNAIKEKLKESLALLEKNTSKFYDIQTKIGFKTLFSFQEDLKNLNEITKCLKETEFCDCLTGGRTTNTMVIMSSIKTIRDSGI